MKEGLLEVLKGKNITIIGHDGYDVDSVSSVKLLSNLLDFLNISNDAFILEPIKENDTYKIIKETFDIDLHDFYCKYENEERYLFLVDHYETNHLGKVIACIDHHPNNKDLKYPYYYFSRSCSTSYLIYELMQECGYLIDAEEAKMIITSMMVDTVSFRSEKTIISEVAIAKKLAKRFNINYEFLEKYSLCLTQIQNLSIFDIVHYGLKEYCFNGNRVKSSYLQLWECPSKEIINVWLSAIKEIVLKENLAVWVFIIYDCKYSDTYEYYITKNEIPMRVTYGKILSRGTNIIPRIEKIL